MMLLPWIVVLLVIIAYSFLGKFCYGCLKRGENSKFMVFKSFFIGSLFFLMTGAVVDMLVCEYFLEGEQGAFSLLFSIISIIVMFLISTFIFILFVGFYKKKKIYVEAGKS